MRVLLDGDFFAEWAGTLDELAEVAAVDVGRLTHDVPELAADKLLKNNAAFEIAMSGLTSDYPPSEILSWERQRAEALAWEADSTVPTPWIDIAASARGLARDEYLLRTTAKVHQFAIASAWLIGRRQAIDDAIRAATTSESVASVEISYELPF